MSRNTVIVLTYCHRKHLDLILNECCSLCKLVSAMHYDAAKGSSHFSGVKPIHFYLSATTERKVAVTVTQP
jgi:hypothetical protein